MAKQEDEKKTIAIYDAEWNYLILLKTKRRDKSLADTLRWILRQYSTVHDELLKS